MNALENKKKEWLEYAVKMRRRGDNLSDVQRYLVRQGADENTRDIIFKELSTLELEGIIKIPEKNSAKNPDKLIGGVISISGLILTFILWKKGIMAYFSLALIAAGLLAFSGAKWRHFFMDE